MRISMLALTAVVILGGTSDAWAAGKPDPTPDWRCRIVFRDAANDKIRSDQGGSYVDGVGGVTCYVINEPGTSRDRWLFMSITGTKRTPPTRVVKFIGQEYPEFGPSYPDFDNHGTFEVKGLAKVVYPNPRDVMPFRAYLRHPLLPFTDNLATVDGDSNVTGSFTVGSAGDTTSSVFVQPIDACSWEIRSYTIEEPDLLSYLSGLREQADTWTAPRLMRITEGAFDHEHSATLRGDFPMPFGATVIVTPNANGCPQ